MKEGRSLKEPPIKKLYYSISEVSEMTSLKPYVLRYWESEFSELRPSKNRAGKRIYRSSDVDLVFVIKRLLYEEKFTIEGAKQKLKNTHKESAKNDNQVTSKQGDLIADIKQGLEQILNLIKSG